MTQPGPKDNQQRFPEVLPNGDGLLFSVQGGVTDDQVYVVSLRTHERRALVKGFAPHYLPTGHLVFVQGGTLFAVRFDAERFETKGEPVTLLEGIRQARSGQPLISYSDVGSIVYCQPVQKPVRMRLSGWTAPVSSSRPRIGPTPYAQPRLAPEGRRVVTSLRGNTEDLVIDLTRGTSSRLTAESNTSFPVWTPDGQWLTLASAKEGSVQHLWATGRRQRARRASLIRQLTELPVFMVARRQGPRVRVCQSNHAAGHPRAEHRSDGRIEAVPRDAIPRRRAGIFPRRQMDRLCVR